MEYDYRTEKFRFLRNGCEEAFLSSEKTTYALVGWEVVNEKTKNGIFSSKSTVEFRRDKRLGQNARYSTLSEKYLKRKKQLINADMEEYSKEMGPIVSELGELKRQLIGDKKN